MENRDNMNTARVIRAGRKLIGKDRSALAELLQTSQAVVADLETGLVAPSTLQWFQLCDAFDIDSEVSYKMGFIDHCTDVQSRPPEAAYGFQLPEKYLRQQGSKARTARPFLKYFESRLGAKTLEGYFDYVKVDPDFFTVYDNQLSADFILDMARCLIREGALKKENLSEIASACGTVEVHGHLQEYYQQFKAAKQLLKSLLDNIGKYESNFSYEIVQETAAGFCVSVTPTEIIRGIVYKDDVLGSFMCDYKKQIIQHFIRQLCGAAAEIEESECHFKRGRRCLYRVNLMV